MDRLHRHYLISQMANTVKLKRSAVQGKVPTTTDLDLGELAVNTYDGKLYTKKDDGTASIVELSAGQSDILTTKRVLDEDHTIASGYNALSINDVEVSTGVAIEVPQDSVWITIS